eukprot:TRINITY_DN13203_c0_g1_i2.p1 TRINITY_DN13203_c0_g1~~TRINITY_DN13203_c0_g1_i2.p1  ORF type:complete len:612 (-),score=151.76 TRINITY_DN13203_c0_g1_i2:171-2006(-)
MPEDKRIDPEDGQSYSYSELLAYYKGTYSKKELQAYWDNECKPVKSKAAKGKAKAKAKAEPTPTAKAAAKAKAKVKAKADAAKPETVAPSVSSSTRLPRPSELVKVMARREKDWRIGPIVYQIFVDRFAPPADFEKKKSLYPKEGTFHEWSELPKGGELVESVGYYSNELAFWGGDLPSLMSKLDYVKDLGVDVMYLQPITECFSNHKYDTSDYKKIDPQYGTDEDFDKLQQKTHESGMKLVLDMVFNHMGKRAEKVQKALADPDCEEHQYIFTGPEYKLGYKVWGCAPSLVELKLEAKVLQNFLWNNKDSVVATWLRRGSDGCRLDVASEIGLDLLSKLTKAAHRHKKGSLVIGEVWAYGPHWTSAMDAVMSLHMGVIIYGLAEGTCPGPTAAQALARAIADSSIEEVLRCWIVVSNHDMPRLASRLPDLKLRKFAQALQFTWPGSPLVYYGDEVGLAGADDPHNRAPFPWGEVKDSNEFYLHTKKCVEIRKKNRALRIGNYRDLHTSKLMAFIRTTDKVSEVVVVVANPTEETVKEMVIIPVPQILGHTNFKDEFSGQETRLLGSTLTVEVEAKTVKVFTMMNEVGNPCGDQYKRTYGHWASFASVKPE